MCFKTIEDVWSYEKKNQFWMLSRSFFLCGEANSSSYRFLNKKIKLLKRLNVCKAVTFLFKIFRLNLEVKKRWWDNKRTRCHKQFSSACRVHLWFETSSSFREILELFFYSVLNFIVFLLFLSIGWSASAIKKWLNLWQIWSFRYNDEIYTASVQFKRLTTPLSY